MKLYPDLRDLLFPDGSIGGFRFRPKRETQSAKWASTDDEHPSEVVPANEPSIAASLDDLDFGAPPGRRRSPGLEREMKDDDEGWRRL